MTTETQSDFARRLGVDKAYITRLKRAGRLVLAPDGKVDVERSIALIEQTGGDRPDVADRFAKMRAGKRAAAGLTSDDTPLPQPPQGAEVIGSSLQTAKAIKEKYLALTAKIDYEQKVGNLIAKEDVDYALNAFATTVRAKAESLPDQLAPILAPITDLGDVHVILVEKIREFLDAVAEELRRCESELGRKG